MKIRRRILSIMLALAMIIPFCGFQEVHAAGVEINETNFPDANFRQFIIDKGYDLNNDMYLTEDETNKVTRIICTGSQIKSLKGIEYFIKLMDLYCYNNQLTSLDVSGNAELTLLVCWGNQLTSLDVSGNTKLTTLECADNQLPSLDVSGNTELTWLVCWGNQLTSLDVSENTKLTRLDFGENQLTSLDVRANTELMHLRCYYNQLASLDVSRNTKLTELYCFNNQLASLDVSRNTKLTELYCDYNQLTSLDVSGTTELMKLYCYHNQLASLDVSRNTKLTELSCYNNQLALLDVSRNTKLTELSCNNNQLTSLDVSGTTELTKLYCGKNQLTSLDVRGNTELTSLGCNNNQLASLDVSGNTKLKGLSCEENQLTSLDVSGNTELTSLGCNNNQLTSLDVRGNTKLKYLYCEDNQLTTINVSGLADLTILHCYGNSIRSIDVRTTDIIKSCVEGEMDVYDSDRGIVVYNGWDANSRVMSDSKTQFITKDSSYTVTFNPNGGTVSPSSKTVINGGQYGDLPTPVRTDYRFDGWFTSASGGTQVTSSTTVNLISDQTLYAHWTYAPETHTVTFDPNGGSGAPSSFEKAYGESVNLSRVVPGRFSYNFLGWNKNRNASSADYLPGDSFNDDSVTTLYAVWQDAGQYSMPFDAQCGIGIPGNSLYLKLVTSNSGQYTISSSGDLDTMAYLYSDDGTLIAQNDDGGQGRNFSLTRSFERGSVYYLKIVFYNSETSGSFHVNCIKDVDSISLNKSSLSLAKGESETLVATVYPDDADNKAVTWSSTNTSVATVSSNGTVTAVDDGSATITATTSNGKYASCSVTVISSSYTVTFNPNGGTVSPTSKTVTNGSPYGDLPTPVRTDYRFDGWFTSASGGTQVTYSTTVNLSSDQTLYAHWTYVPVYYTVKYNANGGTGTPSSQTKEKDKPLVLSDAKPTKSYLISYNANGGSVSPASKTVNCSFKNWNSAKDGSGQSYNPGDTYAANSDVTLYAQWGDPKAGNLSTPTRSGYSFAGWYTSADGGTQVDKNTTVKKNTTLYAHWNKSVDDPYNLGDETYSFNNFGDDDSRGGHCFGMSVTSSGYHVGKLDIRSIGGNDYTPLYSFSKTATVKKPICYYQKKQQNELIRISTVAGGSYDLRRVFDVESDWKSMVNYVKNHEYDETGILQIGFWGKAWYGSGGHAINFIRYENVNGEDRIYAYDNNFPDREVYFYRTASGSVKEAPMQTFDIQIYSISFLDINIYFDNVNRFNEFHTIYMPKDVADVQGYDYSPMYGGLNGTQYVMYEIPNSVSQVKIIPNEDYADFIYMDTEYSFGKIGEDTYGILTFAEMSDKGVVSEEQFQIYNEPETLAISQQPEDVYANDGEKATTRVIASGSGLTYQWYLKNKGSLSFTKSSITSNTYSVKMSDAVDGREVYCVVTDAHGASITSNTATLYKFVPLSISSQPKDVAVANGQKAKTTFVVKGSGLKYQWFIKDAGGSKYIKSSITSNTYSVTMSDKVDGRQVYCVATDPKGNKVTSNVATLYKYVSLAIVNQPQDTYVANGEKATASVLATGTGLKYQWYIKNKSASSFSKSSITTSTYSVTMSDKADGRQVYCVVTDMNGKQVTTKTVSLNKYIPVSIVSHPKNCVATEGEKATTAVSAEGSGLSYQWYIKNKGGTKFSKSSVTSNIYSVTMSDTVDGRQVYCVVTDVKGKTVTSNTAVLSQALRLAITSQPQDCYAYNGEKATTMVKATGSGLKYQWYIKNKDGTKFSRSAVTSNVYSVTMSDKVDGRQAYCMVTDSKGNALFSDTITLGKYVPISIESLPKSVKVSNGQKATVSVKARGCGLKYQWYVKNKNSKEFTKSSVTKNTYTVTMSDSVNGRQLYCIITDAKGMTVQTNTVSMTKN